MKGASMKVRGAAALVALAAAAPLANAHISFKLPSIPGVSPGNAGGYVPLDGPYLSHSPFQLSLPHSFGGNITVGLQCRIPAGLTLVPQEIPGWSLTLTSDSNNAPVAFTYQINADPAFPRGFARASQHLANGMRTSMVVQIGMSTPSGTCTFNDPQGSYAVVNGYPNVFLQCTQLSVDDTQPLTPQGIADLASGRAKLYTLLWTATPANVLDVCGRLTDSATGEPLDGASYTLDPWAPNAAAAAAAAPCTSWPCSAAAPFGGRTAIVTEVASAPRIQFIPRGCTGATCVSPFPGANFTGCPGGTVTMPVTAKAWQGSPCGKSVQASAGTAAATTVGNAPAAPPPAMPPPPAAPHGKALSNKDLMIWLAIVTAIFGCFCVVATSWACARALGVGDAPGGGHCSHQQCPANKQLLPVELPSHAKGNGVSNGNGYHPNGNGHLATGNGSGEPHSSGDEVNSSDSV